MVPISGNWTPFLDIDDQLKYYRSWGLIPAKSKALRPIMVVDGYLGTPEPCKVVGTQGDSWAVIELSDGYHAIHGEYLAAMQPIAHQKLPFGVCFAEILSNYVIVDIETTGFHHEKDRIIEIAAIAYEYGKKVDEFQTLINPGCLIPEDITKLTGISQADVENAPFLEEVEPGFRQFIEGKPLIGHNAVSFDVPFLSAQLSAPLTNTVVDTLYMARKVFELLPRYKLPYLKEVLNLGDAPSHRALGDVETTNALLWACMSPIKYEGAVYREYLDHKLKGDKKQEKKQTPKIKDIRPTCGCISPASPLCGKFIVFTGALAIERAEAMQLAVNAGAIIKSSVSSKTDFLVVGQQDIRIVGMDGMSDKEEKAHALNQSGKGHIQIITEEQFMELLHNPSADLAISETPGLSEERKAFDLIYPFLQDIIADAPIDSEVLIFKTLKSDNGSSVYFMSTSELFFTIRLQKKTNYLLITGAYKDLIPDGMEYSTVASDAGMLRISIGIAEDILNYVELLRGILDRLCRQHRDFGCCGRYEECSNAGKCIHPDPKSAIACWYRYNLMDGKIFYGKNKNI